MALRWKRHRPEFINLLEIINIIIIKLSLSASVNRKFQVVLNKDNRLSLKKTAFLNGKVKLDLTGSKESEDKSRKVSYSLDLSPSDRTLLVIE